MTRQRLKTYYSTSEAARLCGLTSSTIRRWIQRGALQCYRTPGGNIRILLEHLLDFSREWDLPLDLGNSPFTPIVMVYIPARELRERLLSATALASGNLQVVPVFSRSAFWRMLHAMKPRYVVLEHGPGNGGMDYCGEIRKVLEPHEITVGVVCHETLDMQAGEGADAFVSADADNACITAFWQQLLEHESRTPPLGVENIKMVTGPTLSGVRSHAS